MTQDTRRSGRSGASWNEPGANRQKYLSSRSSIPATYVRIHEMDPTSTRELNMQMHSRINIYDEKSVDFERREFSRITRAHDIFFPIILAIFREDSISAELYESGYAPFFAILPCCVRIIRGEIHVNKVYINFFSTWKSSLCVNYIILKRQILTL